MDDQIKQPEPTLQEPIIPQQPVNTEPVEVPPILEQPPQSEPIISPRPEMEITPEPEPAVPSNEYQPILDQYAANTNPEPVEGVEVPVVEETPRSSEEQLQDLGITNPPTTNNIFKIIFTIALIIFILVIIALGFTYFKSQKNSSTTDDQTSTTEITQTPASSTCFLNDINYKTGESFIAADGCNTCTCQAKGTIYCTDQACAPTIIPTKTITPTATSSSSR